MVTMLDKLMSLDKEPIKKPFLEPIVIGVRNHAVRVVEVVYTAGHRPQVIFVSPQPRIRSSKNSRISRLRVAAADAL